MPMTPELRRNVDQIRDYLFGGGYPDPVSNAEQLSFLFFFYLLEQMDEANKAASRGRGNYKSFYAGAWKLRNSQNAAKTSEKALQAERMRWSSWAKALTGEPLVRFVRDEVFPFHAVVAERAAVNFMEGARLGIDEPTVLSQVLTRIDELHLDSMDADTKGDLFEHILKQIKQAGELGQFRTPRHIIRAIVRMVDPQIGETVYDPAAGTAGFLVAAYNHIRLANSSPHGTETAEVDGKRIERGIGDKLSRKHFSTLQNETFYGNDVDPKMVRLATMNLTLRGLENVRLLRRNVLTQALDREQRGELGLPVDGYDVILANPPFSGRIDRDRILDDVRVGTTTQTEILFLKYMMDSLKPGGRAGVIVPEGVLFGSTTSHKELRRQLVESHTVEAVLSLPGGVFQPYSGVKTAAFIFCQGGRTGHVLFLHVDADGYRLDAQHDTPIDADDLPELVEAFADREERLRQWKRRKADVEWTEKWWFADADALRANDFDLTASRYRPASAAAIEHRDPLEIVTELKAAEAEIAAELEALEAELREVVA